MPTLKVEISILLSCRFSKVHSLCEITDLMVNMEQRCEEIKDRFIPLERAYKTLGSFDKERIDPKDEELLKDLKPKHQELIGQISVSKVRMDK